MKGKLLNNLGLKLAAILLAFLVWLGVVNVANPSKTVTREVPVSIVNAEVLEKANMTYEVIGKSTATISFKAKTKDEYKIKADDFYASADIADMYDVTGAIPITVKVVNHEDLIESGPTVRSPEVLRIQTEPLQTKEFALKAYPQGTVHAGYMAGAVSLNPDSVTVKGPQSLVGQISSVGIEFDVSGASSDISGTAVPGFYDANGNALTMDESVRLLNEEVAYSMQVLQLKNIPLNFIVAGTVADGYRFVGAETTVPSITAAGTAQTLSTISEIRIQNPALNVEGARADVTTEVDISSYLPSGVTATGLASNVIPVTLKVEALEERSITVRTSDITLTGENDAYSYGVEAGNVGVTVRGLAEDVEQLTVSSVSPAADVSGLQEGTHQVRVILSLPENCVQTGNPEVTVHIRERNAQTEAESSAAEETDAETSESSAAAEETAAEAASESHAETGSAEAASAEGQS